MSDQSTVARGHEPVSIPAADIERVRQALQGILFGEIRVVIQDGVIVQIERTEKLRLR